RYWLRRQALCSRPALGSSQELSALERRHHEYPEADRAGFNDREGDGVVGPVGESEGHNHHERRDADDPGKHHLGPREGAVGASPLASIHREIMTETVRTDEAGTFVILQDPEGN